MLPVAAFNANLCNFARTCIPQAGTTAKLDALSDRLMFRNAYRNFGTYEAEVVNHTVNVGGEPGRHPLVRGPEHEHDRRRSSSKGRTPATVRTPKAAGWDQPRSTRTATSRSATRTRPAPSYPSIRYTGRLVGDPLGTLPQGETTLIAGRGLADRARTAAGATTATSPSTRSDGCTFWYTQEYYAATGTQLADAHRLVQVPVVRQPRRRRR